MAQFNKDLGIMQHSNWQLKFSSHKGRSRYAFYNQLFCDVEFLVVDRDGDSVTVPANKYPLAVCSPVFGAMFYSNLAETKSPIHIKDCTDDGLLEIIRYACFEEAMLTVNNVMEVLYLAKKYMIPPLEEKCNKYIKNSIGKKSVLSIFPDVLYIGDDNLQKLLWEFVDQNIKDIAASNSFLNLSKELLGLILERDTLKIKEVSLFKAVDRWATKRVEEDVELVCNGETKRRVLGEDIIKLIRFPLMTEKEFSDVVLPSKILDEVEVSEMSLIYKHATPSTAIFSQTKRSLAEVLIPVMRFGSVSLLEPPDSDDDDDNDLEPYHLGKPDSLNFTVNKPVNLIGVRFFGSSSSSYKVELKINKTDPFVCLSSLKSSSYRTEEAMIDGLYYGFTVMLSKTVKLKPDVVYNIWAEISGPAAWYGKNGASVVSAGQDIQITYKKDGSIIPNGTSVDEGQFPSLILETV